MLQRKRGEKDFSTERLVELDEIRFKNYIFNFNPKTKRQKRGTAIGTKFAPPYSVLLMFCLEEEMLENFYLKPYVCQH